MAEQTAIHDRHTRGQFKSDTSGVSLSYRYIMEQIKCSICLIEKPSSDFYFCNSRHKYRKYCKVCDCALSRKRYIKYREKKIISEKKYQSSSIGKESLRKTRSKMYEKYPEKTKARSLLRNALLSGKILKPNNCTMKKFKNCNGILEAHHSDYSKPYDVIWLCRYHHRLIEGKIVFVR